jgi:hypothetical protein
VVQLIYMKRPRDAETSEGMSQRTGGTMSKHNDTPTASNAQPIFVYFILAPQSGHVKIGISDVPVKRLRELQTAHFDKLELITTVACRSRTHARELESQLHSYFVEFYTNGEWFRISREQIEDLLHFAEIFSNGVVPNVLPTARWRSDEQVALIQAFGVGIDDALKLYLSKHPEFAGLSRVEIISKWMSITGAVLNENTRLRTALSRLKRLTAGMAALEQMEATEIINNALANIYSTALIDVDTALKAQSDALKQEGA